MQSNLFPPLHNCTIITMTGGLPLKYHATVSSHDQSSACYTNSLARQLALEEPLPRAVSDTEEIICDRTMYLAGP